MSKSKDSIKFRYAMGNPETYKDQVHVFGSDYRIVESQGRSGLHIQSVHGRFVLPQHTVASPKGTITMWILPLDDIDFIPPREQYTMSNPRYYHHIVFLTDRERLAHVNAAQFAWYYRKSDYPPMFAQFLKGGPNHHNHFYATAEYFYMRRRHWYHLSLTWNTEEKRCRIYANGVLVGLEDQFRNDAFMREKPGMFLYGGSPSIAFSDVAFFDDDLSQERVRALYAEEATRTILNANAEIDAEQSRLFEGKDLECFSWKPDAGWKRQLALGLNRTEDLLSFYHQGDNTGLQVTEEGLRITTPMQDAASSLRNKFNAEIPHIVDLAQMYIFTRKVFEGDLYVTFEFKTKQHSGLCNVMTQVAGMLGEDFMADYPLRSEGGMHMVHCEDLRNYHWEFFREEMSCRADLCSHIMRKNPFSRRVAAVENRRNELDRWYRVHFLQEGNLVRCAIDNTQVLTLDDDPMINMGPASKRGHVGLRCMWRTDVVFRNLEIYTRDDLKTTYDSGSSRI